MPGRGTGKGKQKNPQDNRAKRNTKRTRGPKRESSISENQGYAHGYLGGSSSYKYSGTRGTVHRNKLTQGYVSRSASKTKITSKHQDFMVNSKTNNQSMYDSNAKALSRTQPKIYPNAYGKTNRGKIRRK